jgi:hypothetical protein
MSNDESPAMTLPSLLVVLVVRGEEAARPWTPTP